jgi:Arc/MetJ-type ribon-helix-helix transcriptional regulator
MIVCFTCTTETKDELDRLIQLGSYRNYGEAIAAAVRNQLLMEREIAEKGAIIIGHPPASESAPHPASQEVRSPPKKVAPPPKPAPQRKATAEAKIPRNGEVSPPKASAPATVPAMFRKEGLPETPPEGLAGLPADIWVPGQVVPLDRWVLGQQNRLLPAKVNARGLIRLFLENPKGLPISQTAGRIAAEAAALGDYLSALDEAQKVARDDALAIAFPTTEYPGKGQVRYANQFVAYQNGRGELSGLMVDLKLVNVTLHRTERLIVPTRMAWEFAQLPNPVLDGGPDSQAEKFTPAERALLIRHIASSVPVEAFAYRAILEAVEDGNNTPDTIDAALKKSYVTEERAEELSQSFLASQRSGAVSRMSDLGLIERQREGVRVSYALTEEGQAFLAHCGATKQ